MDSSQRMGGSAPAVTRALLHELPKTDLHVHLDGSLRPGTMLDLAREYGVAMPAADEAALADYMFVKDARNLVDYLQRFDITLSVMQTAAAIERIAYELAEDAAAENVRYMEVRFCPVLNTRQGLGHHEAVQASLQGLRRAELDYGIRAGVIVCGLRNLDPSTSLELAEVAVDFIGGGVVAFDLAGAENGHPPTDHQAAFDVATRANLPVTIHAGEAFGATSIHQAVHACHARRIGHGTRLHEDPDLLRFVNDFRIPLEVCLTSNVQTRVTSSMAGHPARLYYDHGLVVTLNTDNRLMSRTSVTEEYWQAHTELAFDWDALCDVALMGFEAAFLPYPEKSALMEAIAAEILELGTNAA
ncbi:MAG: adenosine deaminase [Longimicrobiales bacterium]